MNKIVLIGDNSTFSKKTNKIAWIISGTISITLGVSEIYRNTNENLGLILSVLLILAGCYSFLYAFLGLSKKSKFAPKVILTDDFISIKKSFWKPAISIKWIEIFSIDFQSYQIIFRLKNEVYTFDYETNADTSVEIKRAIREFANSKSIEIIGG